MKKRVIALILAAVMVFSMTACGSGSNETGSTDNAKSEEAGDDAADSETAGDVDSGEESTGEEAAGQGTDMNIAMITDSGDITDQSFNSGR